jgi:hypothetical protein
MALATIRYDRGQGNAALYVRARNAAGQYRDLVAGSWVANETANCKVFLTEIQDADLLESRYSATYSRPSGDVVVEYVRASDSVVIGDESFVDVATVQASLSGSGVHPVTVRLLAGGAPAVGVLVQAFQGASLVALGHTDVAGEVEFALATASVDLVCSGGQAYAFPRTASGIAGATTIEIAGVVITPPPAPPDPDLCLVYEFLRRQDGAPAAKVPGSVKIVGLPANYAGALFTGALVSHSTDTTGYIAWTVPRGATIAINIPNFGFDWAQKVVPAATTVRVADL